MTDLLKTSESQDQRQRRLILGTAMTANLLGNMGLTGINVAAPAIQKTLELSASQESWLSLSALLAMAMFSAPMARLSDLVGRRLVTVIGLWITIAGSIGSALSWNLASLLVTRAVTGVGLVAFFTTVTTMVAAAYPREQRGRVLGLTISSVYIGLSLGPLLSGFMVEKWGWPALFWFTVLGLLPPLVLINMVRKEKVPAPDEKPDFIGSLIWMLAVAFGFVGLSSLGQSWLYTTSTILGFLLFLGFLKRSLGSENPVLDLRLFLDSRRFSFSSLAAFISYMSSFSIGFLLSLYLQHIKDFSPSKAGLFLVAQPLIQAILTPISGRLSDRVDPGRLASIGLAIIFVAVVIFGFYLEQDTSMVLLLFTMGLCGAGFAMFSAPNSNAIMSAVPSKRLGQASGVITVTRLCGQISSIALTTLIFNLVIGAGDFGPEKYPYFLEATKLCFKLFAPLCILGIIASQARGHSGPPEK